MQRKLIAITMSILNVNSESAWAYNRLLISLHSFNNVGILIKIASSSQTTQGSP